MGVVALFCAVVGTKGGAFLVEIDTSRSVDFLKKAIKTTQNYDFEASELKLFLAKKQKSDPWLNGISMGTVTIDRDGNPKGFEYMVPTLRLKHEKYFGEDFQPGEGQIHVLVVVSEHVLAFKIKGKRRKIEDTPDIWMKALKEEQVEILPQTCQELKSHLERELRVKLPISDRLYDLIVVQNAAGECTSSFYKLFGREHRVDLLSERTMVMVSSVVDPILPGCESATAKTYIHLWDSLIATVLRRASEGSYLRNPDADASSNLLQPNLCFYYRSSNVCVFRGKEKASGDLQVPLKELHDNLEWKYDDAPYIFGYAAVRLQVCLVAIRKDEMTNRCGANVEIIETYNLGDLSGRLSFFLAILNLSTLFRPIVDLIKPLGVRDYGFIENLNGVRIEFAEDCVVKTYPSSMPSDTIIRSLKNLHDQMKTHSVPNVVELKKTNLKKKRVVLKPIGLRSPPKTTYQLLMALRDILEALVALHAINLMHRDLRWENVLKYVGESDKWFLIDFDDGAFSPAQKSHHLKPESHAPEMHSSSTHGVKVDIWSVGYLLETSPVHDLPAELVNMKDKCLQTDPKMRPTAKLLLKVIGRLAEAYTP